MAKPMSLPDGRYTVPNSKGAWEVFRYINERPRRRAHLLRLFSDHREITTLLTTEIDQSPWLDYPGLITTIDSEEGRKAAEKRKRLTLAERH